MGFSVLFVGMIYTLIVFLPMIYDYLLYEEYDEYENLSYIEYAVEYVKSSFYEAFGGIFEFMAKLFFRPVTKRLLFLFSLQFIQMIFHR